MARQRPSSQFLRRRPHRASPRPSHRYFHSLTSVLLPGGALFRKGTLAAAASLQRAGLCPIHPTTALGEHGEGLAKASLAARMPNPHRDPATGIPGREGCCQAGWRCTSKQLQTQRNEGREVQGEEPGKWLETKPRTMSQQLHPFPSSSPSGQEKEKVEGQAEGFLPLPCQAVPQPLSPCPALSRGSSSPPSRSLTPTPHPDLWPSVYI